MFNLIIKIFIINFSSINGLYWIILMVLILLGNSRIRATQTTELIYKILICH
ncbi:MAG: hypothetical protein IEMM0003_0606 [bacterium]|nr:MAG: hypothetical protein IEMM0003_0606 [bacterium]